MDALQLVKELLANPKIWPLYAFIVLILSIRQLLTRWFEQHISDITPIAVREALSKCLIFLLLLNAVVTFLFSVLG